MYYFKKLKKKFLKGGAGEGVEIRFKTEFWKTKFEFEKKTNLSSLIHITSSNSMLLGVALVEKAASNRIQTPRLQRYAYAKY